MIAPQAPPIFAPQPATPADLNLRLRRVKVKGLGWISSEFRGKRGPELDFRGASVMLHQVPLQTQKSQGENPNLTGKVTVAQIWFRPRLCALQRADLRNLGARGLRNEREMASGGGSPMIAPRLPQYLLHSRRPQQI